jgi:hypothetical protein
MPLIDSVSSLIGNDLAETLGEIIDLHYELKQIVSKYTVLSKDRKDAAEAADEYLRSQLISIPTDRNRIYVVRGIESEMSSLLKRTAQIEEIIKTILNKNQS